MSYFFPFHGEVFTGENYKKIYLQTSHWKHLTIRLIHRNRDAHCFICERTNTLLLHHERYDHLFHERLFRDVFIICYTCHKQIHFHTFLLVFTRKTALTFWSLKRRRLFLRFIFCVRNRKFFSSTWYFFRYLLIF